MAGESGQRPAFIILQILTSCSKKAASAGRGRPKSSSMAGLAGAGGGARRKARQAVASYENKGTCLSVRASLYEVIDGLGLSQRQDLSSVWPVP